MQTAALGPRLNTQDAPDDGVEARQPAARLLPKAERQALVQQGQVVYVRFPLLVPGDDSRIIPFGRYDLTVSHQNGSSSTTPEEVVLVNLGNGARLVLSVQELTAMVRDPDVEII